MTPRAFAASAALVVALAPPAAADVGAYRFPAPLLHEAAREARVWLPPSYRRPDAAERRYPVIYLLHGWPGFPSDWFARGRADETADSLLGSGAISEVILVAPDGRRGWLGRTLWMDAWNGSFPLERHLLEELVPWVDRTFRTRADPAHRGVIGLSDGAVGALRLALRHPGTFGAAAGHSGNYDLVADRGVRGLFAPGPDGDRACRDASPLALAAGAAAALRSTTLYLDCGAGDESLGANRALDARLDSLGVPHVYREFPGGHGWGYWRAHLRESLATLAGGMR